MLESYQDGGSLKARFSQFLGQIHDLVSYGPAGPGLTGLAEHSSSGIQSFESSSYTGNPQFRRMSCFLLNLRDVNRFEHVCCADLGPFVSIASLIIRRDSHAQVAFLLGS
jgi:hypothetical protein